MKLSKVCNGCEEMKNEDEYHKDTLKKDGLRTICKKCTCSRQVPYRKANKEAISERDRLYRKRNPEKMRTNRIEYKQRNPEEYRKRNKVWQARYKAKNPGIINAKRMRYYASKKKAVPGWLTPSHRKTINKVYEKAKELEKQDGIRRNVDHIVPLQSDFVCGLHVPWNLQILTEKENRSKNNKLYEVTITSTSGLPE